MEKLTQGGLSQHISSIMIEGNTQHKAAERRWSEFKHAQSMYGHAA
jgi:hypothetical protein